MTRVTFYVCASDFHSLIVDFDKGIQQCIMWSLVIEMLLLPGTLLALGAP